MSASYVVLQGFEITGQRGASLEEDSIGIQIEPRGRDLSHIEIRNNVVHEIGPGQIDQDACYYNAHGIIAQAEGHGTIADNVVLDASNYWPYCSRGNCTYPEGDESSDGIYVDGGADLDISYNVVGRADHGIELQSENGQLIRNVEVAFNVVFNSNYEQLTIGDSESSSEHDNVLLDDPALDDADLAECTP